jgi:hypothetical protein
MIDCWARSGKKRHEKHDEGDIQLVWNILQCLLSFELHGGCVSDLTS